MPNCLLCGTLLSGTQIKAGVICPNCVNLISIYSKQSPRIYPGAHIRFDDLISNEITKPPAEPSVWSIENDKANQRCKELGMPFSFYQNLVTAAKSLMGRDGTNLLSASITKDGLLKLSYPGYDVLMKITEIDVVPNDRG